MSSSTAVVTGGAQGIGLAIAKKLSAKGHKVLVTDVNEAGAEAAAAEIGGGAWSMGQDVRDPESHKAVAAAAAAEGPLKVWVNNAGILITGSAWEHSDEEVANQVDINVLGTVWGARAAISTMGSAGGSILNVASISALTPVPGLAMYAATKACVLSMTTSIQGDIDHAGWPIQIKALCPDVVGTEMVHTREKDPGAALLFAGPKPLSPDAVAQAGLELLDSKQIWRVIPRWRGAQVRVGDLAPSVGLKALAAMRKMGDKKQSSF